MENNKASQVEFHIHELTILLTLLERSGGNSEFPIAQNDVVDLLSMMRKKAEEAGIIFQELLNGHE
jgi:hypothetical protein